MDSKVGFSILSLNIQNISSKFSNFETFLDSIERSSNNPISIIALQECWLHDSEIDIDNFNIPNYTMVHKNRLTPTDHGGLIIYVHNQFQYFDVNINLKLCLTDGNIYVLVCHTVRLAQRNMSSVMCIENRAALRKK